MQISADFDVRGLTGKTAREEKRLAFNVAAALNNTAKTAQANIRAHMVAIFTLRSGGSSGRQFLLDRVKLNFASAKKGLAFAEVYVDQKKDRLLLAGFEDGALRGGFVGKSVAEPNPSVARIGGSVAGKVDPKLVFQRLNLKPSLVKHGTEIQWKGNQRTFELRTAAFPLGAVFQRVGPGPDDIRVVYAFRAPFHLKRELEFVEIAAATMKERFAIEWAIINARNPSK